MTLAEWMEEHPGLSGEWDRHANINISPDSVSFGSKKRAWWKCDKGHTWQAAIDSRTGAQKANCPYCSNYKAWQGYNDLATVNPRLAAQWCHELNGELKPTQVTKGSHKKVWWKCSEGHVWEAMIFARSKPNGTGCPICSGKLKPKNE